MKIPLHAGAVAVALSLSTVASGAPPPEAAPPAEAPIHLTHGAPPPSAALVAELAEKDRALFDAVFGCKLDALPSLVADDLEFLHDKHGLTAASGKEFVDAITQGCKARETGQNFRARRELVPGSMTVHVLQGYGAMQMGEHRFYALRPGKPDLLTESGKFIDVWKEEAGSWKLARVISYDHQLASPGG